MAMNPNLVTAMIKHAATEIRRCCDDLDKSEHDAIVRALRTEPSAGTQGLAIAAMLRPMIEAAHSPDVAAVLTNALADVRYLTEECLQAEREAQTEHERHMRTSSRYRRAEREGAL